MHELNARSVNSPPPGSVPVTGRHLVRTHLREELREVAWDLIGRPDRDELTSDDLRQLSAEVEDAVEVVLEDLLQSLERALTPRVEALPLRARLQLANVRLRRQIGYD
jgi:hypothetical protein